METSIVIAAFIIAIALPGGCSSAIRDVASALKDVAKAIRESNGTKP